MPEVLGNPPSPRTALFWNGTAWQWARVDAAGHLQIDVLTIAAGVDVATAANQATMITALQLIDNLVVALGGPGNLRLQVRGEDQLFSFAGVLAEFRSSAISGADGWANSVPCAAGEIWCVTGICARDVTSPTTAHEYQLRHDAADYRFGATVAALAAGDYTYWDGFKWLDPVDAIRVYFPGGLVGDTCHVTITGYIMTLEV